MYYRRGHYPPYGCCGGYPYYGYPYGYGYGYGYPYSNLYTPYSPLPYLLPSESLPYYSSQVALPPPPPTPLQVSYGLNYNY